jgi:leucokinin receptor
VIAGIWVISGALAAPMAVALRVTMAEDESGLTKPFCYNVNLSDDAMLSYRVVLLVLQYLIPLCVISCVYIRMALTLWGSKTPGNAQSSRDATLMKNKKKVGSAFLKNLYLYPTVTFRASGLQVRK